MRRIGFDKDASFVDLEQPARLYCPVIITPYVIQTERENGTLREMTSSALSMPPGEIGMTIIQLENGRILGSAEIAILAAQHGISKILQGARR